MKYIGIVVMVAALTGFAAYSAGWISGSVDVQVTPEGEKAARKAADSTRETVRDGLRKAAESLEESP